MKEAQCGKHFHCFTLFALKRRNFFGFSPSTANASCCGFTVSEVTLLEATSKVPHEANQQSWFDN